MSGRLSNITELVVRPVGIDRFVTGHFVMISLMLPSPNCWDEAPTNQRSICSSKITALDSARHILELREVERLRPFETALGEHLKHRFDALGVNAHRRHRLS